MFCSHSPTCTTFSFSNLSVENWIHKRYTEQRNYMKYLGRHRPFHKKKKTLHINWPAVCPKRAQYFSQLNCLVQAIHFPLVHDADCHLPVALWCSTNLLKVSQEQRQGSVLCSSFKQTCYWRNTDSGYYLLVALVIIATDLVCPAYHVIPLWNNSLSI